MPVHRLLVCWSLRCRARPPRRAPAAQQGFGDSLQGCCWSAAGGEPAGRCSLHSSCRFGNEPMPRTQPSAFLRVRSARVMIRNNRIPVVFYNFYNCNGPFGSDGFRLVRCIFARFLFFTTVVIKTKRQFYTANDASRHDARVGASARDADARATGDSDD